MSYPKSGELETPLFDIRSVSASRSIASKWLKNMMLVTQIQIVSASGERIMKDLECGRVCCVILTTKQFKD